MYIYSICIVYIDIYIYIWVDSGPVSANVMTGNTESHILLGETVSGSRAFDSRSVSLRWESGFHII